MKQELEPHSEWQEAQPLCLLTLPVCSGEGGPGVTQAGRLYQWAEGQAPVCGLRMMSHPGVMPWVGRGAQPQQIYSELLSLLLLFPQTFAQYPPQTRFTAKWFLHTASFLLPSSLVGLTVGINMSISQIRKLRFSWLAAQLNPSHLLPPQVQSPF